MRVHYSAFDGSAPGDVDSVSRLMDELVEHPELRDELGQVLAAASRESESGSVSSRLKIMQHPVFAAISRVLEESVPRQAGFGKFRGQDK